MTSRLVSAALVGLVASTVGVPLFERAGKGGDKPFPCQGRACGCASADACWRGCCCSSPSQRLAWAKAHGVRPPEELVEQVRQLTPIEVASGGNVSTTAPGAAATAGAEKKACCHGDHDRVAKHVPSSGAERAAVPQTLAPRSDRLHVTWMVGSLVSNCRGQTLTAGGAMVALPPAPTVCWSFDWCVVECLPATSEQFTSLAFPPPIPPPRI